MNFYKQGITLWFPLQGYMAYKGLKTLNEISLGEWFKSIFRPHMLPHFKLIDLLPTIIPFISSLKNKFLKAEAGIFRRPGE